MFNKPLCTLVCSMFIAISPGYAQKVVTEPAVATAQKYLQQTLPGAAYESKFLFNVLYKGQAEGSKGNVNEAARVISVKPLDYCLSKLQYAFPKGAVVEYTLRGEIKRRPVAAISPDFETGREPKGGMNFEELVAVEQNDNKLSLSFNDGKNKTGFDLSLTDKEHADKVKEALMLLKTECMRQP